MKKGAIRTSGILTLIVYIVLFAISVFIAGSIFEIEFITSILSNSSNLIAGIISIFLYTFIGVPILALNKLGLNLDGEMLQQVFSIIFAVFSLFMIFWGIKEISLSKSADEKFSRCKQTCAFMMFIKFMLFAYFGAVIACYFVVEGFNLFYLLIEEVLEISNISLIILGALAFLSFITWILPVANIAKGAKYNGVAGAEEDQNQNIQYGPNGQPYDPNYNNYYQPTMQANMPPIPGYQPQYNQQQSVQAQFNPQVQKEEEERASQILPGQNGVPENITEKGIADLERLTRLRASGAITEENFQVMWQKICNTNLS